MTRDYMDRPVELLLMDAFLLIEIENIAKLQDETIRLPLVIALGFANIDRIDATHEILVNAEKRAAQHVVNESQRHGYIDVHDWHVIGNMIRDMGTQEDRNKWN